MKKLVSLVALVMILFLLSGCVKNLDYSGYANFVAELHQTESYNLVKQKVAEGGDVNAQVGGFSPLLHICLEHPKDEKTEILEFLVKSGADVNSDDSLGRKPIHVVKKKEHLLFLLGNGADIDAVNSLGQTPLSFRIYRMTSTLRLVENGTLDLSDKNMENYIKSDFSINALISKMLINNGADITKKSVLIGGPLVNRVLTSEITDPFYLKELNEIASLLISKGALNIEDDAGDTPLSIAVKGGNSQMVKTLLKKGADPFYRNKNGHDALWQAVNSGKMSMVELLTANGSRPNFTYTEGQTLLHIAAQGNNMKMAQLLVFKGANPTLRNNKGQTADDIFAENSRTAAAKARQAEIERQESRRQQQNNDQLFGVIAGIAMGVAMDNAGGTADQVVQSSMAMYSDVSNNTTSSMQSLIDQYNQESPLSGQTNPTSQKSKGCAGGISGTWKASGGKTTMTLHSNGQAELTNVDTTGQYRVEATFSWDATAESFSTNYDTFKMVNIRTGKVEGKDTPRSSSASCSYSGNTLSIGGTSYSR